MSTEFYREYRYPLIDGEYVPMFPIEAGIAIDGPLPDGGELVGSPTTDTGEFAAFVQSLESGYIIRHGYRWDGNGWQETESRVYFPNEERIREAAVPGG